MSDNAKLYYLRDPRTMRTDRAGTVHRPDPVAVVATDVDRHLNTIRYAVALVHTGDTFNKKTARKIVLERLHGFKKDKDHKDILDKPKSARVGRSDKSCSGARTIVMNQLGGSFTSPSVVRAPLPNSGHEITELVMRHIFASTDLPDKLRNLANDWLRHKDDMNLADQLPTIPAPAMGAEEHVRTHNVIPPPPLMPRPGLYRPRNTSRRVWEDSET